MVVLGLAALVVIGLLVALALVVTAVGSALKRDWRRAGAQAVLAVAFVGTPVLAAQISQRSNDWVDADSNGMLDPMTNGSYDWIDINGAEMAIVWGLLYVPLLAVWVRTSREGGST